MNSSKILLSPSSYFILNKDLIHTIGLEATLVLSELMNTEERSQQKNKDGYFLTRLSQISKTTSLSNFKIKNAINKIFKTNLIDVIVKGDEKIYVNILHLNILNHLNIKTNLKSINKTTTSKKNPIKIKKFKNPTKKELKSYFLEIGQIDESSIMFDYYESKGWKVGKTPMKCWKSATRNWVRRLNKKSDFPDYYDKKIEQQLIGDPTALSKYHHHLKKMGWESIYSPSSGTSWRKKNK